MRLHQWLIVSALTAQSCEEAPDNECPGPSARDLCTAEYENLFGCNAVADDVGRDEYISGCIESLTSEAQRQGAACQAALMARSACLGVVSCPELIADETCDIGFFDLACGA